MREEQEEVKDDKLRTRSFRCSDEVFNAIRELCAANGYNQQEAMVRLLEAWNFVQASQAPSLVSQQDRIKKFSDHMNVLQDMFVGVLSDMATMDDTISTNYRAALESKEARLNAAEAERDRAKSGLSEAETRFGEFKKEAEARIAALEKYNEGIASDLRTETESRQKESTRFREQLTDKERIIAGLEEQVNKAKAAAAERESETAALREEAGKAAELKKEVDELKDRLSAFAAENAAALEALRRETVAKEEKMRSDHAAEIRRLTAEAEFEQKKAVFEAEAAARKELETGYQKRIMEVQKQYAEMFAGLTGDRSRGKL